MVTCKSILTSQWFIIYTLKVILGFYVIDQYRVVDNCLVKGMKIFLLSQSLQTKFFGLEFNQIRERLLSFVNLPMHSCHTLSYEELIRALRYSKFGILL